MPEREVFVIAGLGFGDEGKGTIVDYLTQTKEIKGVVRYNGGPQAAHHVVLPDGRWHCFSQFTAGSFVPEVRSHLSHSMLVKPSNFLAERDVLRQKGLHDIGQRTSIDPNAYIVTPWDAMLGRMDEVARGAKPHGSVGMGVGKAAFDRKYKNPNALQMLDLLHHDRLRVKLQRLWEEKSQKARNIIESHSEIEELVTIFQHYKEEANPSIMYNAYCEAGAALGSQYVSDEQFSSELLGVDASIVLEGAQGVLLDYSHGFYPHVTKTDTTFRSADDFIERAGLQSAKRHNIGILRAYGTRHGAGPFITENGALSPIFPEPHNGNHRWQGTFRVGYFDAVASRYAIRISGGVDYIALTHLDVVGKLPRFSICNSYLYTGIVSDEELERYVEFRKEGHYRIVQNIRISTSPTQEIQIRLTELLRDCKPHALIECPGWGDKQPRKSWEIPLNLRRLLHVLESESGLNCPIKILSFGPTAQDKVHL